MMRIAIGTCTRTGRDQIKHALLFPPAGQPADNISIGPRPDGGTPRQSLAPSQSKRTASAESYHLRRKRSRRSAARSVLSTHLVFE